MSGRCCSGIDLSVTTGPCIALVWGSTREVPASPPHLLDFDESPGGVRSRALAATAHAVSHGKESTMLTAQDNATLVRAHYDAFNRRDFDKALTMVTADVKWKNI